MNIFTHACLFASNKLKIIFVLISEDVCTPVFSAIICAITTWINCF